MRIRGGECGVYGVCCAGRRVAFCLAPTSKGLLRQIKYVYAHARAHPNPHTQYHTHTNTHTHTHTHTNTHTHEHTHILRLPAHLQGAQGTDSGDEGMLPFRGKHTMSMLANLHTRMLGGETVEA